MVSSREVRIASRGSELALWQAHTVGDLISRAAPAVQVAVDVIRTTGDRVTDVPLARIGGRGVFTKELDEALLDGRADLAVHSLKDVPTRLPEGLTLAAVTERADPRDVLLCPTGVHHDLRSLPAGSVVGTSSLRRQAQLRSIRPDVTVADLRGNLNTRLARLDAGDYTAILLAAAGVLRLGWESRISTFLEPDEWLPAVGQGALGLVARADDGPLIELLRDLDHAPTLIATTAERVFLRELEGGCQIPIGALARVDGDHLRLDGLVSDLEGARVLRRTVEGASTEPERLGRALADRLREDGAEDILAKIRGSLTVPAPRP